MPRHRNLDLTEPASTSTPGADPVTPVVTQHVGFGVTETANENSGISQPRHASNTDTGEHASRHAVTLEPIEPTSTAEPDPLAVTHFEARVPMDEVMRLIRARREDLPARFPGTASAHASVKRRGGQHVARRWRGRMGFAHFLEDMGPRRHDGLTVDRIDTDNPTYGPGLCRWANAVEQANNRTTTTDVYDPREDEWAPRAIVARRHELEPDAIRQAMRRGASAAHVIQQMLDRRAARPSTTPTGRTAAAERPLGEQEAEAAAQAEAAASGHVEPIPDPPVHLASDPVERWPWPLTLAKRVQWEDLFQASRAFFPHGHEWRFEFGIRTARRAWEQHNEALADMLDAWGGEPTLEEEEEYDRLDRRRASLDRHLWEAEARRAAWINDIGNRPRADAPRDRARMLEDHGPDFARLMDETSWRQFMRSTWERRATERREAARTDGYALVHDRRHFHAAPDAGSTSRIKRYALVPVSRQARAPAHPLPTYSAADIMPEPVPMHEDGFPIDDDFREAREWGRRMEAAMQQADAMPPPRVAPVALKPSRQRVPRR